MVSYLSLGVIVPIRFCLYFPELKRGENATVSICHVHEVPCGSITCLCVWYGHTCLYP